jgi:Holliday junction DNA helicase RuvA
MIHSLRGKVKSKSATNVVVDVRGVAFYVVLSVPTADRLPKVGEEVEIRTYLKVREDAMELYGFGDEDELTLFKMLIGISKIGPKLAMGILSGASPDEFKRRIVAGDVASLMALPGIGSKTAKRIIVELKDKFVVTGDDDVMTLDGEVPDQFADALATLTALGFHRSDGFRVLSDMQRKDQLSGDVEEIVKIALTKL